MLAKSIYYLFILKLLFLIVISDEIVPKVRIAQGEMQGKVMKNLLGGEFFGFQGIPYAKPPIGSLRFKSPEPAEPWTGILNATQEGADCFQMTLFPEGYFRGSEDCLFINVYTPKLPEKSDEPLKPVMVLLHGGGYIFGNGGTTLYGPEFLLTQDIVYVGFNYRLNVFGFLSFEDPTIGVPGNAGLKDMVQALKWVQANIASFGGDPNKVTIFGESAGGASVAFMLLSPSAKGLFHRAISQSGVATVPWVLNDRQYQFLAENLKYPSKNFSDQQSIFEFLNNTSAEELIRAQLALDNHPSRTMGQYGQVGPVVENPESNPDAFLTDHPETILKSGPINQVPYILGFLRDEGALFLLYTKFIEPNFTDSNLLVPKFINVTRGTPENKEIGDKIKQFYYGETTPSYENIKPFIEMTTDIAFSHKIVQTAKRLLERMTEPIYFYYFQYKTDMNYMSEIIPFPVDIPYPVVVHGDDNGYLFPFSYGPIDVEPDSVEMRGIHRVVKFWTNFARTGNPNTMDNDPLLDVKWPAASLDQFHYLNLQDNLTVEPLSNLIPERLAFWDALDK